MFTVPAGATTQTACQGGCSVFFTSPGSTNPAPVGGYELGTAFKVSDPGVLSGACYTNAGGEPDGDTMTLWKAGVAVASGKASGYCFYWYYPVTVADLGVTFTASYHDTVAYPYEVDGVAGTTPKPDITGIAGVYSGPPAGSFPGIAGGFDYAVGIGFYSAPVAPTVTVTAASPTSANSSWVGDSQPGSTITAFCSQTGAVPPTHVDLVSSLTRSVTCRTALPRTVRW